MSNKKPHEQKTRRAFDIQPYHPDANSAAPTNPNFQTMSGELEFKPDGHKSLSLVMLEEKKKWREQDKKEKALLDFILRVGFVAILGIACGAAFLISHPIEKLTN